MYTRERAHLRMWSNSRLCRGKMNRRTCRPRYQAALGGQIVGLAGDERAVAEGRQRLAPVGHLDLGDLVE